jgi:hypothetical protein
MKEITKKLNKIVLNRNKSNIEYKKYHLKYLNQSNHNKYYDENFDDE